MDWLENYNLNTYRDVLDYDPTVSNLYEQTLRYESANFLEENNAAESSNSNIVTLEPRNNIINEHQQEFANYFYSPTLYNYPTSAELPANVKTAITETTAKSEEDIHKKPFKCHLCKRRLTTSRRLANHLKKFHAKKKYLCEYCGKVYPRLGQLKHHISRTHLKIVSHYNCLQCGLFYDTRSKLEYHVYENHDKRKPQDCFLCNKKCSNQPQLYEHILVSHGGNLRICPLCSKYIPNFGNFLQHIQSHVGATKVRLSGQYK